jgi:hypothetical protein
MQRRSLLALAASWAVYDDTAGWPGDCCPVPCKLRRDMEIEGRMKELFCSLRFTQSKQPHCSRSRHLQFGIFANGRHHAPSATFAGAVGYCDCRQCSGMHTYKGVGVSKSTVCGVVWLGRYWSRSGRGLTEVRAKIEKLKWPCSTACVVAGASV